MKYKAICPECGSTDSFEEILRGVTASSSITFGEDGEILLGISKVTGWTPDQYYQCTVCGHILPSVSTIDEFEEWVNGHEEKEDEKA